MDRQKTNEKISKALHAVPSDLDAEYLFGLTQEEYAYAVAKVAFEASNPVGNAMVLGACLARQKILGNQATGCDKAASKSAQGE